MNFIKGTEEGISTSKSSPNDKIMKLLIFVNKKKDWVIYAYSKRSSLKSKIKSLRYVVQFIGSRNKHQPLIPFQKLPHTKKNMSLIMWQHLTTFHMSQTCCNCSKIFLLVIRFLSANVNELPLSVYFISSIIPQSNHLLVVTL